MDRRRVQNLRRRKVHVERRSRYWGRQYDSGLQGRFNRFWEDRSGGSCLAFRSYRRLHRRRKGHWMFARFPEPRSSDGVPEYRENCRYERAQVDETRTLAVYHLWHDGRNPRRERHKARRTARNVRGVLRYLRAAGVQRGRRGAVYGVQTLHQRERGDRPRLQTGNGKSNRDIQGKTPVPA